MEWKEPENMDELVYMTIRTIDSGKVRMWVFRGHCPECKKGLMTKPKDPKTGKFKIRATEYVCSECNHEVEKAEFEETLTANAEYTCPKCSHEGKIHVPFKRKTFQGTKALVFECESCKEKIPVTKKMKDPKKK